MVKFCAVFGCRSKPRHGISLFEFPKDKLLRKVWASRTKRKYFVPTCNSCICSKHFTDENIIRHAKINVLKKGAIPSQFEWTTKRKERRTIAYAKPVSTPEKEEVGTVNTVSNTASTQTEISEINPRFGVLFLSSCDSSLIRFYTGFKTIEQFYDVLESVLPGRNRRHIVYYSWKHRASYMNAEDIFHESALPKMTPETMKPQATTPALHKLSVEDELLLTLMKLRLGLFYTDLATRFGISVSSVHRIFYTWIKFLYIRLGSLDIFPHRDIITSMMQAQFKRDYPNTMIIIDCTELYLATPSSFKRQSQTYSNYKSTNTVKGLIGVDSRGSIMFVSQLYTGSISDKELCNRSGFFEILKRKLNSKELLPNDAVMADKGFIIEKELNQLGLKLNIPPFLQNNPRLTEEEVLVTRTIAQHRIHVERAIRKIKQFHIFDRKIPVSMLGILNELWLVCCMLTNFHDPIISDSDGVE